jgi:hypothetical protein
MLILLLFPLFSFSQEAIIAIKHNGLWSIQVNIVSIANAVKPAQSSISYDTAFVDTSIGVIVLSDWSGNTKITDRVVYQIQGDTMYTQFDIYTQVYLLVCENSACCIDCRKGTDGKCSCVTTCDKGKCDERTYGTTDIPSIGISNAIRNYLN